MASITFRKSTKYGTEPYAVLTVTQGTQEAGNNRTYVNWSLVLYRPSNVISSTNKSYSVVINGSTVASGTYSIGGSGTKTINSGGLYVSHNSDGTKTLSFSGSVQFGITWSGTTLGTIANSGSMTLTPFSNVVSDLNIDNIKMLADGASKYTATAIAKSTGVQDTIVLTLGSYSKPLESGAPFTIPVEWNNAIPTNSDHGTATVTLTTKNGSTTVGSVSTEVAIYMPESIGKPSKPKASVSSKTALEAILSLTQPTNYKYGASFLNWHVSCSSGVMDVTGDNVATLTRDSDTNETVIAYVRAVDSRGLMSDAVTVPCYVRKNGFCVYENGVWKQASSYVYVDGEYKRLHGAVYNNGWQKHVYRGGVVNE